DAHLDPSLVLARDLAFAEERQGLTDRQLAPPRLVDQAVELVADCGQLEPVQHGDQVIVLHHQRPPASRSYSISGRSSSGAASSGAGIVGGVAEDRKPTTP